MATIIRPDGACKKVKDLGWILRHWDEIDILGFNYSPNKMNDGEFVAKMKDGSVYFCWYASLSVFWNWALRPNFIGLKLRVRKNYDGPFRVFTIGDEEYKRINKLPYKEQMEAILETGRAEILG